MDDGPERPRLLSHFRLRGHLVIDAAAGSEDSGHFLEIHPYYLHSWQQMHPLFPVTPTILARPLLPAVVGRLSRKPGFFVDSCDIWDTRRRISLFAGDKHYMPLIDEAASRPGVYPCRATVSGSPCLTAAQQDPVHVDYFSSLDPVLTGVCIPLVTGDRECPHA